MIDAILIETVLIWLAGSLLAAGAITAVVRVVRGPSLMDRMRQFQPIHRAGHLDVGEQEFDVRAGFQQCECVVRVNGLQRREAGILDHIHCAHP